MMQDQGSAGLAHASAPGAPAFSVVIPTYNRSSIVPRAISSVLAQTVTDFELIVVDDGSTDDTANVVSAIRDDRIRLRRQQNGGLSAARNAGAQIARGRWLTFLDDDDQALPCWLELFRAERADPASGIVCCGRIVVDAEGAPLRTEEPMPLGPAYDDQVGSFASGTFAVRRELFESVGGYAPGLQTTHGTELAFRLVPHCLNLGLEVRSVAEPGVKIEARPPTDRPLSTAALLYEGVVYVLEHHRERISRSPRALANYLSIAGVSAARIGKRREARRLLAAAVRAEPRSPRRWARLAAAWVPSMGQRVWRLGEGEGLDAQ
ncbi:MAG: glycosyltransferase family A protein [Acidimicrobiia bacterium]